ncbi:hypothetical protein N657DRAFT_674080 [Parathielavia appendiculata]|uniref:Uncharacterized protein n=1 Tax=Parathielavia appendiculata TaxID=2587402 RepID=A0AAN6TU17_9PEZI|nr:hypothetical protein N657DRAFT_674080 [Parathielavia appendiculata]
MSMQLFSGNRQPLPSEPTKEPEIITWPVQRRKMRHKTGHRPTWIEIRNVASRAVDDALRTHTVEKIIDIVRKPARSAGLKASRNKGDKDAQLKREYHNMVLDLLEVLKKQAGQAQASGKTPSEVPKSKMKHRQQADSKGFSRLYLNQAPVFDAGPDPSKSSNHAAGEGERTEDQRELSFGRVKQSSDDSISMEWVIVEEELYSGWVSVNANGC